MKTSVLLLSLGLVFSPDFSWAANRTTVVSAVIPALGPALVPAIKIATVGAGAAAPLAHPAALKVAAMAQAAGARLEALAAPSASDADASGSGENLIRMLQGAKAEDEPSSYLVRHLALAGIAANYGISISLPKASAELTALVLAQVADKRAALSDIDDTLGPYGTGGAVLDQPTVESILAVRRAGKFFAAITDRSDKVKPGSSQLSAFDSLAPIPADQRQGMMVATNGGGRIYEYDAQGAPVLVYEEPPLPEAQREVVKSAAAGVLAQLAAHNTALESENHGPYGYSMILKAGTPEATVKALAHLLESQMHELAAKLEGEDRFALLSYRVEGRMAKNPALSPYLTFSKLNKAVAVRNIARLKGLTAAGTVLIGDSMYAPRRPAQLTARGQQVLSLGERLSGMLMPLTGNPTDRNMEIGLPGAMALSVGGTADPTMSEAYVLDGKGAELSRRILNALASKPAP